MFSEWGESDSEHGVNEPEQGVSSSEQGVSNPERGVSVLTPPSETVTGYFSAFTLDFCFVTAESVWRQG